MIITLIAAMAENRVIARDGDLPWRLPKDLARFKKVTLGHAVIMGRKTMDTLPAPLSGRHCIVMTRETGWTAPGVAVAHSLDEALAMAREVDTGKPRIYIAGGGEIYREALPLAAELDITRVRSVIEGDTYFPAIVEAEWVLESAEEHPADDRHSHSFRFERWRRIDR